MPKIHGIRSVVVPQSHVLRDRREYVSPDRRWSVVYHTPREFHMGAEGWRVKLLHRGLDVRWQHRKLSRLAGGQGFRCEEDLRPWSHDSKALVFLTWDEEPVHIYDVAAKLPRQVPRESDSVFSVQWSPGVDRLLVTSATSAVLTDQAGIRQGSAEWSIALHERPHTDWTKDGRWFFVLARASASTKVMLTFYAGEDGTLGEAYELDPADVVPYDAERFAHLPRDRFCLVVTPSMGSVGQLLDTWHGVHFDQASSTLYLAVYRPDLAVDRPGFAVDSQVSAALKSNAGGEFCNVEERWVAVELAP